MAISVHPPRASAWAKWWRRNFWWPHVAGRRATAWAAKGLVGHDVDEGPVWPVMLRMVVPGWPQIYQGKPARGCWFLGAYLLLAAMALSSFGTSVGAICLGLAVAAHASSVLDVVIAATSQSRARLTYAMSCLAGVALTVYLPLAHFGSGWIAPREILLNLPPFARGDVVLASPALYTLRNPQPGDVVLYDVSGGRVAGRYWGRAANYAVEGPRIDRIIAGPGQHVQVVGGKLVVDGRQTSILPLEPGRMPAVFDVQAPPGCYVILPSTALPPEIDTHGMNWEQVSLVPAHRIAARVYLRHWPWTRFSLF